MGENSDKAKGKLKQAVGNAIGDKKLEREGQVDEAKGHAKGAVNKVKGAASDAKNAVKKAVKRVTT
jgi:uncharacterized protein YjbJ (UPF0337 family)